MRAYDSDGNGSLDSGDAAFGRFAIWKDADSDARVDPGELLSLEEIGLTALALDGYLTGEKLNGKGNVIYATTDAVFADNRSIKVADVLLGYDGEDLKTGADAFDAAAAVAFVPAPRLDAAHIQIA